MSAEFIDTNVLVYAHDEMAGWKQTAAARLLERLDREESGALSIQVLVEFYANATKKLQIKAEMAEDVIGHLTSWAIHSPSPADLLRASQLHRRHQIAWWDALIVTSAMELGCSILWTEDLSDGRRFGALTVRNPFKAQ